MPTFSNSSLKGFDLRLPLFINFSPSIDATVTPRICTSRAAQTALEFRYYPYEDLYGRFYGEYTYDWKYGPEDHPRSHRFYATWLHDQDLNGYMRLKANGNWVSDRNYFELWGGRFDKRLRIRYLESNAILYKQLNNFLFLTEARHFDNLDLPDNARTVQNAPIVTGTMFNQQIPFTPFYFGSNVSYNYYFAPSMHDQWLGSRIQMDMRLSLPIAVGRYLKLEPSTTYFPKAYFAEYYQRENKVDAVNGVRGDLYQVNTDAFTDIYTIYGNFFGFERVKHNFRPRVSWNFRPFSGQGNWPHFDEFDRVDRLSLLTAEMRHTLTGKLRSGEYLDFLSLNVSQGYDFDNTRTAEDPLGPRHKFVQYHWTNTFAEFTLKPHTLIDMTGQAEYDPVVNRVRSYSVNLGLMDHRGDLFRVVHQFTENEQKEDLNRQTFRLNLPHIWIVFLKISTLISLTFRISQALV
jgi:LPS-assembly protein